MIGRVRHMPRQAGPLVAGTMAMLFATLSPAARREKPTDNGDPIGVATSDRAGRITLQLRSVQCDGMIAESLITVAPGDANYGSTIAWLGGIARGQTKPIIAKELEPCKVRR